MVSNGKPTILIVEDSPQDIKILGELLKSEYNIKVAKCGEKALKIVESDNQLDLMLLDIILPGIDGYEVCKIIKRNVITKDIPVIFITSRTRDEDQVNGFEMGAFDYITKPFSPIVVKVRVKNQIDLKKYRDMLVSASYCDGLTAIANRRRFDEYYEAMWKIAIRKSYPISLIMVDIDQFKQFNDYYGHQEGDITLIKVAKTISLSLKRKSDLVARYGGEEFICIMPDTELAKAIVIAEEIRNNVLDLKIPNAPSTGEKLVSVSLGIACEIPNRNMDIKDLLIQADENLYKAKKCGRNKIMYYK